MKHSDNAQLHALVTGAGTGIGRAVTLALAERGYHVLAVGRRTHPLLEVAALAPAGTVSPHSLDVGDPKAVGDLLAASSGRLAVAVASAGTFTRGSAAELHRADWDNQIRANLTGAFETLRASIARMSEQKVVDGCRGHVFTINSGAGIRGFPTGAAYSASKHGLRGLVESIRMEIAGSRIKLTDIIVSATVESEMNRERDVPKVPATGVAHTLMACLDLPGAATWDCVEFSQLG